MTIHLKSKETQVVLAIMIVTILCAIAALADPHVAISGRKGPWYSIVPPLLAVALAFLTHRVITSIAISLVIGGLLVHVPQAPLSLTQWGRGLAESATVTFSQATDPTNLQILLFVVLVMAMISLLILSGGLSEVVRRLTSLARGRTSTLFATMGAGLAIFFDDYANTMIVGSSMRPATDKHRISREKLAFIVDATSAPVAGLAIISTWIGYEVGLFGEISQSLNLGLDGYALFFSALGFRFYCWMMLGFVICNIAFGSDFGPMARAEKRALETGEVIRKGALPMTHRDFSQSRPHSSAKKSLWSALLPLAVLISTLVVGFWIDGKGPKNFGSSGLLSWNAWRQTISQSEHSIQILAIGGSLGLAVAILCATWIARLRPSVIGKAIWSGVKSGGLPIIILIFAWSLKGICVELSTGHFLATTLGGELPAVTFPAILFVTAAVTAFGTGTSWGTMAILIPTAIPIAHQIDGGSLGLVTLMSLGAVLDGSIFGDHCSPISDTTLLSSIASDCNHMDHVETQMPYALTVATAAILLGYLPAAMGVSPLLLVGLSVVGFGGLFYSLKKKSLLPQFNLNDPIKRRG